MKKYTIKNIENKDNQLLITIDNNIMFISYKTIVFNYNTNTHVLEFDANDYTYTKTTCKYLTQALELLNCYTGYKSEYLNRLLYSCNNRKSEILKNNKIRLELK